MSLSQSNWKLYLSVFCFSLALSALRNLDPIFSPVLFAEDGTWLANGVTNGWLQALTQSRPDYPVFLQIVFLFVASSLSTLFSGNPLISAPYFIAVISWAAFAAVATLIFIVVLRITGRNRLWSAIATFFFISLPVGGTANEIYGRVLQLGFLVPVAAFLLMFARNEGLAKSQKAKLSIDFLLMIFMATNPVTPILLLLQIAGIFTQHIYLKKKGIPTHWDRGLYLVIGFALASILYVSGTIGRGTGLPGSFEPGGLFPAVIRAWLYPYIFPFFTTLNSWISLALLLAWFGLLGLAIFKLRKLARLFLVSLSLLLIVWTAISLIGRPALTHFVNGYSSSFPDRYYIGLNTLSILITTLSLWAVSKDIGKAFSTMLGAAILASVAAVYALAIFEAQPRMPIAQKGYYINSQICDATTQDGLTEVSIYPSPWKIQIPNKFDLQCAIK